MLYHRDEATGMHVLTHRGRTRSFPSRAAALAEARTLLDERVAARRAAPEVPSPAQNDRGDLSSVTTADLAPAAA